MAKIDTSKIEGFSEMTPEQQLKALQDFDMPDPDYTGYIKKDTFDKTASELAEIKRQSKAKLTADEQRAQEQAEMIATMQGELEALRQEKQLSSIKASYLGLGYSDELASEISTHTVNGDTDKVFACQKKFLDLRDKEIEKKFTNNVPPPASGSGDKTMTKAEFKKLSPQDRYDFAKNNAEVYNEMYNTKGD